MGTTGRMSLIVVFTVLGNLQGQTPPPSSLELARKIPLPNVKGRIDHMAIDAKGKRLFVACLGNNTVEVVDLKAGKRVHTISGIAEPQGVLFLPEYNRIYITSGGTGECSIFNGQTLQFIDKIKFSDNADNIRYDPSTGRIYVGYGPGGIGVIDAGTGELIGDIKLLGHPEAFVIDKDSGNIFVNVPAAKQIEVVDSRQQKIRGIRPLKVEGNYPIALDSASHRLFVASRKPARLLVFDARSVKLVRELNIDGMADDIFYDAARKRIYVSCGAGFIDVVEPRDTPDYVLVEKVPTAAGARTSLFVPESATLYLAVPAGKDHGAAIYVYGTKGDQIKP